MSVSLSPYIEKNNGEPLGHILGGIASAQEYAFK